MIIDLRCSYCSSKITVRNPAMQANGQTLNVRCPKCKNILKVKTFEDGTSGELVKEVEHE